MIESIGVQHVRRRRRSSSPAAKTYKPLDKVKQHPVHKKRIHHKRKSLSPFKKSAGLSLGSWFTSLHFSFKLFLKGKAASKRKTAPSAVPPAAPSRDDSGPGSRKPMFPHKSRFMSAFLRLMYPAFAAAIIGLLVLILYCSFSKIGNTGAAFITPREDSLFQVNMASYAGLYPQAAPSGSNAAFSGNAVAPETGELGEDIPLDLTETFSWETYTVKKGDTVSKIAADRGISMDAVIASNSITNVRRFYEGQVIKIPNMDGIPYTVKNGDSLLKISGAMKVPLEAILDANDLQSETIIPGTVLFIPGARMRTEDLKLALGELFIYPIRGRLTSAYGWRNDPISGVRRFHAALDLAAPIGTPVKATMDGRVSTVGFNGTYGKFIILSHNSGFQTMYAHLSVTSVTQGSYVNQGSKIGEVGSTGYSTGPHLHFAAFKNGRPVNPNDLLSP
jgi:murein DD-endopeptidase MepM/ murein hydrolase activator NlpD